MDTALKLILLCLLLAWSGYFVYRLATGLLSAWASGRFALQTKGRARVVRAHARPIEFWSAMAIWHVMLVVFAIVFGLGLVGLWRVAVGT